jgi:diguanylate cyclase (GGDEF)-like protein
VQDLGDRVAVALATAARDRELYRRANYDPLTRLPNRTLFLDELGRELARAERQSKQLAVLFVDLDGFSDVNDSLGHAAGDELLVRAGERLRACVRKSDLVARLGGDEFTAVLPDMREASDAATVAQHLIAALSQPYDIGHGNTFVAASVGIAMYPADGATAPELLRHADMAMYQAKERGRGSFAFFEDAMHREAQRRLALDRELRQALENEEFVLYYQPQLDLRANRIVGAEALIRWQHPTRGIVAPGPFISFAEETGLIEQIGEWALNAACEQFMVWKRAGAPIDHVSVNVSPRQFRRKDFADSVARAIRAAGLEPGTAPGDHRERAGRRQRRRRRDAPAADRSRNAPGARRLRHGLLLARVPAAAPGRHDQAGPLLHQGHPRERQRAGDRARRDRDGARAQEGSRRRGRRDRRAARAAARVGLRRDPGLPPEQAGPRRRVRRAAARPRPRSRLRLIPRAKAPARRRVSFRADVHRRAHPRTAATLVSYGVAASLVTLPLWLAIANGTSG